MKPLTLDRVEARLREAIDAGDHTMIDALGKQMDSLLPPKSSPGLTASALWYAEAGLHVFPLRPGEKIPMPGSHGCKDATNDRDQILAWWTATPTANIGIATGHMFDVIDIDGAIGVKAWAGLKPTLPPILGKVSTPRPGGTHLFVAATGRGNRAGIAPGVDYRGEGGYVVAAPSATVETRENGKIKQYAGTYTWYQPLEIPTAAKAA